MSEDALAALRAATAERHALLDASLPLGGPAPTLDDYRAHLRMLRNWLAPIVAWLDGFEGGPRISPLRLVAIEHDLVLIGELPPLAVAAAWPHDASQAYRWGVCYVVEGSQLGGAVLYKKLAEALAPHPLGYLKGEGNPGPGWRGFMDALRAHVQTPPQVDDATRGACTAFDRLINR